MERSKPTESGSETSSTYAASHTLIAEEIAAIWAQVLGIERVGIDENFLTIGGNSLVALQIMMRMREAFGTNIDFASLLRAPSVAAMAKEVEGLIQTDRVQSEVAPPAEKPSTLDLYDMFRNIRKKLGTRMSLKSDADLVALVEERLPVAAISALMEHGVLEKEIYSIIVPRRTLQHRRARKERLSREESDRAVRLARLVTLTENVFGNHASGMHWLRSSKKRFHGRTPMAMMETEAGSRLVEEALYQIDEGMAA